jgi:polymorphic toxin system nucleotidyltransferase-like protein
MKRTSPGRDIDSIREKFEAALDRLVEQVKGDRSILAAILCGSLSHDKVWEKSDIDLILVTIDDKSFKNEHSAISLYADDVNVHAFLIPRTQFRQTVEGSVHNSFMHSLLAKGKLLYTHDDSLEALCRRLADIGERDTRLQMLAAATTALPAIYKARKFLITRGDLDYAALWILYAATPLAKIEVMSRGLLADREVLPQALKLNPRFFRVVYTKMLNLKKTKESVVDALFAIDLYLNSRLDLFNPIVEHLREVGEARTASDIEHHFERNFGIHGVTTACEFLADRGLIGKASIAAKLTKRSNLEVQELAFVYFGEPDELPS